MREAGASVSRRLARSLARPVDEAARRRAALHVLDWIGTAAIGLTTPAGRALGAYAGTLAEGPSPTLAGPSLMPGDAALVEGALGNTLEMDDFHRAALVHPGPVVIPATLALAVAHDRSGPETLDAIVRGYEAMIRVGSATGPAHYRYWHKTATCGAFGVAAAATSILGLGETQAVHALGNAGTQAAGLWQCRLEPVMTKQLHNGQAARAGILAAELAAHGFTGPEAIFEGELGFFAAMCPDGNAGAILAGGEDWLIHQTSFKPWPACRHTHPVIGAAMRLRERVTPGGIKSVRIETYRDALDFCNKPMPSTFAEAQFSLQHAFAVSLVSGAPGLGAFREDGRCDAAVAALRAKVVLAHDREIETAYPNHFGARVLATTTDGEQSCLVADARGDPEDPLSEAEIADKACALLVASGGSESRARAVAEGAVALADGGRPAELYRSFGA